MNHVIFYLSNSQICDQNTPPSSTALTFIVLAMIIILTISHMIPRVFVQKDSLRCFYEFPSITSTFGFVQITELVKG
jgi:hypothetical protein